MFVLLPNGSRLSCLDGALGTDAQARRVRLEIRARPWAGKLPVGSYPMEGSARRGRPAPRHWGGGARRTDLPSGASALGAPRTHGTKRIDERMFVGRQRAA